MRREKDFIGGKQIDEQALYGIHSLRAAENFPDNTRFHYEWYKAIGTVKRACYLTYRDFAESVRARYPEGDMPLSLISPDIIDVLISSAAETERGEHFDQFIIPAVSGGAGTSINMNVNEIITNRALIQAGYKPGDYDRIDPVEHANIYQSTNDVIPTSLKIALMRSLKQLELTINDLRSVIEQHEKKSGNLLRTGYTQMQQAVPTSYGRLFSSYNDALSRDWWRVSKCTERIRTVNLGGSAIGSGIAVPRYFIMEATAMLKKISGLPVSRSENMHDATSNLDSFVEVHAIMKAHAVNLEKMVSDIRLLSSDILKEKELKIPDKQAGSSVMPGKVNPVIPEFIISAAHKVYANDLLITGLCALGCLELNAYLPVIGHALLESLKLLQGANQTFRINLLEGLEIISETAYNHLISSPSLTTALLPYIGYNKASELAFEMKDKDINLPEANKNLRIMDEKKLAEIIRPENLLKEGFSIKDIAP